MTEKSDTPPRRPNPLHDAPSARIKPPGASTQFLDHTVTATLPIVGQVGTTRRAVLAALAGLLGGFGTSIAANAVYDRFTEPDMSKIEMIKRTAYGEDGSSEESLSLEFTGENEDLAREVLQADQKTDMARTRMIRIAKEGKENVEDIKTTLDETDLRMPERVRLIELLIKVEKQFEEAERLATQEYMEPPSHSLNRDETAAYQLAQELSAQQAHADDELSGLIVDAERREMYEEDPEYTGGITSSSQAMRSHQPATRGDIPPIYARVPARSRSKGAQSGDSTQDIEEEAVLLPAYHLLWELIELDRIHEKYIDNLDHYITAMKRELVLRIAALKRGVELTEL